MKYRFVVGTFLLFAWGITGCSPASPERTSDLLPSSPEVAAASPRSAPEGACVLPIYQLDDLRQRLLPASRLTSGAVAQLVRANPQLPAPFRDYDPYVALSALDTVRCGAFTLVPVFYQSDDCCEDLYYLTFAAGTQQLLDWRQVASRGMDGQWHAEATMHRDAGGGLVVTELVDESEDEGPTYYRDSVVIAYSISAQGQFRSTRLDSVRTNRKRSKQ